jgi:hypothetical protein
LAAAETVGKLAAAKKFQICRYLYKLSAVSKNGGRQIFLQIGGRQKVKFSKLVAVKI